MLDQETIDAILEIGKLSNEEFDSVVDGLESEEGNEDEISDLLFHRCGTDVELFSDLYFSQYKKFPFNDFHRNCFNAYKFGERRVRRANSAPRGYAKSVLNAVIKPIHDVCYKLENYICIVSNTSSQAVDKLKDISTELLTNDLLIHTYGPFFKNKTVGSEEFIANCSGHTVKFHAIGSGTEIRGARYGEHRPSKIVCDDVEHSTEVENEAIRDKYENWYKEVVSKIGDTETNIEFVGTVLHQKSLLKFLINNPVYCSSEYKAIIQWSDRKDLWEQWRSIYTDLDNDGRLRDARLFYEENEDSMLEGTKVLWPEKESYYYLQEEIIETGLRAFYKEKQNDPMSDESKVFDPEDFRYFTVEKDGLLIEGSTKCIPWYDLEVLIAIDPATGQTKPSGKSKGDFCCILVGLKDTKGRLFVLEDSTKRDAPSKYIKKLFDLYEKYDGYKVGVETNLYKNLLMDNLRDERKRREKETGQVRKIKFYDIHQTENKEKRIYTIEPKVNNGWILFNKTLSNTFMDQVKDFPKGTNDDAPDTLEMLWSMVKNKFKGKALSKSALRR